MKNKNIYKRGFTRTPKFGVTPKGGGFTLIELLVVVAIIGVLTTVVLISLNSARNKGADTSIRANLDTIRTQAELFFVDNDGYLPAGGETFDLQYTCPAKDENGTNMLSKDKVISNALQEAMRVSENGDNCYNSPSAWTVAIGLRVDPNTSWCVDSVGNAKIVSSVPDFAINETTFECN